MNELKNIVSLNNDTKLGISSPQLFGHPSICQDDPVGGAADGGGGGGRATAGHEPLHGAARRHLLGEYISPGTTAYAVPDLIV